ncbi:hypothetical protein EVAR_69869_1 [Eumeta japonica]|uniref:Uncharacterized protein n=1 Tax=Eumeta variegata TaxID=151549 RepID=A0A4C2AEI3_EUMVA|nr:hypothetical protein EVAR_69869_1 [Eumeta japonica]
MSPFGRPTLEHGQVSCIVHALTSEEYGEVHVAPQQRGTLFKLHHDLSALGAHTPLNVAVSPHIDGPQAPGRLCRTTTAPRSGVVARCWTVLYRRRGGHDF